MRKMTLIASGLALLVTAGVSIAPAEAQYCDRSFQNGAFHQRINNRFNKRFNKRQKLRRAKRLQALRRAQLNANLPVAVNPYFNQGALPGYLNGYMPANNFYGTLSPNFLYPNNPGLVQSLLNLF